MTRPHRPDIDMTGNAAPLRLGLIGLFGSGNFGNDGSLEAMISHLRQAHPGAELLTICNGPGTVQSRYATPAIAMATFPFGAPHSLAGKIFKLLPAKIVDFVRALNTTRRLDAVIAPGTGPLGIPLDLLIWSLAARLTGTKLYLVSIGAGPLVTPVNRYLMVSAARLANWRSYRDQGSKTFLARQGVDTSRDPIYPDIAFGLTQPPVSRRRPASAPLCVGLGVMSYRGWKDRGDRSKAIYERYLQKLTEFALWLLQNGHRIRLLTGDASDRETAAAFHARITAAMPDKSLIDVELPDTETLHDVMGEMASTDVIVATRFHNIVCALKVRKPVLSIGYAQKNALLLAAAGLDAYCVEIESFSVTDLKQRFQRMIAAKPDLEARIDLMLEDAGRQLEQQYDVLDGLLAGLRTSQRSPKPTRSVVPQA